MGSLRLVAIALLLGSPVLGSPAFAQSSSTYGVGRTPTLQPVIMSVNYHRRGNP